MATLAHQMTQMAKQRTTEGGRQQQRESQDKSIELVDTKVLPAVERHIEELAEQGLFNTTLTPATPLGQGELLESDLKSFWLSRPMLRHLQKKLIRHDLMCDIVQEGGQNALYISWEPEDEEQEYDEEYDEEEVYGYKEGGSQSRLPQQQDRLQNPTQPQQQGLHWQKEVQQQQLEQQRSPVEIPKENIQQNAQGVKPPPPGQTLNAAQNIKASGRNAANRRTSIGTMVGNQIQRGLQGPGGRFRGLGVGIVSPAPKDKPNTLADLFSNIRVMSLVIDNWARKRLVLIGDRQPLDKALQRMNRHQILSLPVIDEQTRAVRGVMTIMDVVNFISTISDQRPYSNGRWQFSLKSCGDMLENCHERPMVVSSQVNLLECVQHLANYNRLMVVDKQVDPHEQTREETEVIGIITQADILRFLALNPAWLYKFPKAQMTIKDLQLGNTEALLTVDQDTTAYAAFVKMSQNNVTGLAVVDGEGQLVDNLSASNIRGISRVNFQILAQPISVFLARDRKRGWWSLPAFVKETDSFEKVMLLFTSNHIHRLYVVDANNKPMYVITQTDMIKQLCTA